VTATVELELMVKSLDVLKGRQKAYSNKIHALNMIEGWWWDFDGFKPRPDQPTHPQSPAIPFIWEWSKVGPLVHEMADPELGVGLGQGRGKAERRVLCLRNPGLMPQYAITNTFFGDIQIVRKGEVAPSHRHTTTAARFIFEGNGGWTTVEGERALLKPGDLVINQQLGWHDHGNDTEDNFVFFDVLDIPLLTSLATATWDFDYVKVTGDKNKTDQPLEFPMNFSNSLYQSGGIVPKWIGGSRSDHSPMLSYRWDIVRDTLKRLRKEEGSPYDGIIVEFTNPATGGSVGPTMQICAQLIRPGEKTLSHRHNTSVIFIGAEGKGYVKAGDTRIDWGRHDIFCVPSWHWHEWGNDSNEDAIVYSVSDAPVIEKLGLYCEQRKTREGGMEFLGWKPNRLTAKG
jgi:gentisate 1,2-dioxygenase